MSTWRGVEPPVFAPLGAMDWLRAGLRGVLVLALVYAGLVVFWGARGVEWAVAWILKRRPRLAPRVTTCVSRGFFTVIGMGYRVTGTPMRGRGAVVANHSSWLDIFALNACQQVTFVSKEDVARWPVIGGLAKAVGTLFIKRDPKEARAQQDMLETRIRAGDHLVFFPEGTSSDGLRILPFKSTLFAAFFTQDLKPLMRVQPVSVIYHAPPDADPALYGFWGDTSFAPHFARVLGAARQGSVEIVFHPAVKVEEFASRKELCAYCEGQIRAGFTAAMGAAHGAR